MEFSSGLMSMIQEGGVWVWAMFPLFLVGLVVIAICGVAGILGRRVPSIVWYLFPALVVIWAELGASVGYSRGFAAVMTAEEPLRPVLEAAAQAVALEPLGLAYQMFGITMIWASFWAALSCVKLQSGGPWKPLRSIALCAVWLVVCGVALCTPIFASLGITSTAVYLCLFFPTWFLLGIRDADDKDEANRMMFGRGLTVWMVTSGCLAFAFSAYCYGLSGVFDALANAAPEQVRTLVHMNNATLMLGFWIGVGGMVVTLLTGLMAFGRQIRVGAKNEDLIKAGMMVALVALWVLMLIVRAYMGSEFPPIELNRYG